jgi:two-component system, NarL family, sensor histidine kinase DevS
MTEQIPDPLVKRLSELDKSGLELLSARSTDVLFKKIVDVACHQVDATYAFMNVRSDDHNTEEVITFGLPRKDLQKALSGTLSQVLVAELRQSSSPKRKKNPLTKTGSLPGDAFGIRSAIGAPIRQAEKSLGEIVCVNKRNGEQFTVDDEKVIGALAVYAAAAITNTRVYAKLVSRGKELVRRNENLALLNQLAVTLASSTEINEILDEALKKVMEYLRLDVGEVYLRQEESKTLRKIIHRGSSAQALWTQDQYAIGQGYVGTTARYNEPRVIRVDAEDASAQYHPSILEGCFHEIGCFPLTGRKGPVGVLCVGACQRSSLDETEQQFLSAISTWIGMAIENILLNLKARRLAILEERERIGMDLHDGIIQSLYAVGLNLENVSLTIDESPMEARKQINRSIGDLNAAIRDIRSYILDLRPHQLYDESLMEGIQRLILEFKVNTSCEVYLQGPASGLDDLGKSQALALFHICQEALANIAKHAHAKKVEVILWLVSDRALLEIKDDGRGFDTKLVHSSIGHGLANMQTRASNAGGEVDLSSETGKGTSVLAWVPLVLEE